MSSIHTRGFTIVEVSAVIAISGLLFFGVMAGISLAVQRQRFSDGVFSAQSYIQNQYDSVTNVVNNRSVAGKCESIDTTSTPRGQASCAILGRVLVFNTGDTNGTTADIPSLDPDTDTESVVKSYVVVGGARDNMPEDDLKSSLEVLNLSTPYIKSDTTSNNRYIIPWGVSVTDIVRQDNGDAIRAVAILRSPKDGSLGVYTIPDAATLAINPSTISPNPFLSPKEDVLSWEMDLTGEIQPLDTTIQGCLTGSTQPTMRAGLYIQPFATKDSITTEFEKQIEVGGVCPP